MGTRVSLCLSRKRITKTEFLFSKSFRDKKTIETRKLFPPTNINKGRPRFFYFETYCALLKDLKTEGWIEANAKPYTPTGDTCL